MRTFANPLMLAPSLIFALVFFVVPLALVLGNSFTATDGGATFFTLAHYRDIVTDSYYWEVMLRTMRVSFFATLLALIVS